MNISGIIVLLCIFMISLKCVMCDNIEKSQPSIYCTDLNPQNALDIEQVSGMWYGSEILQHHETEERELIHHSCVIIHLADITHQMISTTTLRSISDEHTGRYYNSDLNRQRRQPYNYLRLIWDETDTSLEYTLRYNNSRKGFWLSSTPQQGSMINKYPYSQFTGTIQVMKAIGSHIVLTFCQTEGQLFSIILSRSPNTLTADDIQSVRSLLKRRGLNTSSIRKVCQSGSTSIHLATGIILLVFSHLFLIITKSS